MNVRGYLLEIKQYKNAHPLYDNQGDQMSLWKKSPRIQPNPIFVTINA
jgi:hypothetical protein